MTRLTANLPDELGREVKHFAERDGVTVSAWIAGALEARIQAEKRTAALARMLSASENAVVSDDYVTELKRMRLAELKRA